MAYNNINELPQDVQNLPQGAQQTFLAAFNSAQSDGMSEDAASQVAWNTVKYDYEQGSDGKWQPNSDKGATRSMTGNMPAA